MQRKTIFVENEYYHLYNRGVDKRIIFSSNTDYERFLILLYLANDTENVRINNILKKFSYEEIFSREHTSPLVAIGAFCLMPNHFHILATPLCDGGLSKFMLKLQTGYSMYFNTKHDRNGSLFQGPFKSEHTKDDTYLKYLFSYIHLNPTKLKDPHWKEQISKQKHIINFIETYPYSSLKEYLSKTPIITNPKSFPDYFSSEKELTQHISDWFKNNE